MNHQHCIFSSLQNVCPGFMNNSTKKPIKLYLKADRTPLDIETLVSTL